MDPQYQQPPQQMYAPPPMKRTNGMAITALVLGLLGLFLFGIVLGPLAIIFGAVGMSFANKNNGSGKGLAVAGLVLGILDCLVFVVILGVLMS